MQYVSINDVTNICMFWNIYISIRIREKNVVLFFQLKHNNLRNVESII